MPGDPMRRLWILTCAVLACAWLTPGSARRAAAQATDQWPPRPRAKRGMMIGPEPMMDKIGGGDMMLSICRRGKRVGYNGLVLWDSSLWERDLPFAYMENARVLKQGLHDLNFTLVVEM